MLRACLIVLPILFVYGCSGTDPVTDAAQVGVDAEPPCDTSHPGVRLRMNVTFESPTCSYASDREALRLATTGPNRSQLSERFSCGLESQASPFTVTTTLAYPEGTVAGPASVAFYAINADLNWDGSSTFTADPGACVEVDLPIRCYRIGTPDAGASDAGHGYPGPSSAP